MFRTTSPLHFIAVPLIAATIIGLNAASAQAAPGRFGPTGAPTQVVAGIDDRGAYGYGDGMAGNLQDYATNDNFGNESASFGNEYSGLYRPIAIGDRVWNDLDADGIQEEGEPALEEVQVTLFRSNGEMVESTMTDAGGVYYFENLTPGDYYLQFDLLPTAAFSPPNQGSDDAKDSDADSATGKTKTFTLAPGDIDMTWDAGQYCLNHIQGVVFEDKNQDGQQGLLEPGLADVTLDLYRDNGDGRFDAEVDALVSSAMTRYDGNYQFEPQPPDAYFVVERQPDGYDSTTDDVRFVQLQGSCLPGAAFSSYNFGDVTGSIGDFVLVDVNGNGVRDVEETQGIEGAAITVKNIETNEVFTIESDAQGGYRVTPLKAGTYEVSAPMLLQGLVRTTPSPQIVTLDKGQDYLDADFGYIAPTGVTVIDFVALRHNDEVLVRWSTVGERQQMGFRVWRAIHESGPYEPISDVIPAQNNPDGASYEWTDRTARTGMRYWYKLECLSNGEMFGPTPVLEDGGEGEIKIFFPFQLSVRL